MNECKASFNASHWHHGHSMRGITGRIPAGLDIISFDSYELANESALAPTPWWLQEPKENQAFTEKVIVPKLHPHQKLMVVPGFYGNDTATAAEHAVQDGRLLAKLEAYWAWVKDDENMIGLNPYHWVCLVFRQRHHVCFAASHELTLHVLTLPRYLLISVARAGQLERVPQAAGQVHAHVLRLNLRARRGVIRLGCKKLPAAGGAHERNRGDHPREQPVTVWKLSGSMA